MARGRANPYHKVTTDWKTNRKDKKRQRAYVDFGNAENNKASQNP